MWVMKKMLLLKEPVDSKLDEDINEHLDVLCCRNTGTLTQHSPNSFPGKKCRKTWCRNT